MPKSLILGADRGLGAELVRVCRRKGWKTIEVSERELSQTAPRGRYLWQCDLLKQTHVKRLCRAIEDGELQADIFFWVAGKIYLGPFAEQAKHNVREITDVNWSNSLLIAHAFWRAAASRNKEIKFCVIGSTASVDPGMEQAVYAATKAAQLSLARSLGKEAKGLGLKVSIFMPGGMNTPMRRQFPEERNQGLLDPAKVAEYVVNKVEKQNKRYQEEILPRGSL
jgi:short-subunit dehydrogenase